MATPTDFDPMSVLGDGPASRIADFTPRRAELPPQPAGSEGRPTRQETSQGPFICGSCHTRQMGKPYTPGSVVFEGLLWLIVMFCPLIMVGPMLLFGPLAIAYSAWRRLPKRRKCVVCGGKDLVHV